MKLFQIAILLCLCLAGCKEEYDPKVKSSEQSVLVVEGVLNSGGSATNIRLTRTYKLDDSAMLRPEIGAQLIVESKNGTQFPLYDMAGNGNYQIDQLALNPSDEYRLRISTWDGKQYASDYMPVQNNPPIDSISWKRDEEGVRVFVNTHNPEGNTRYYRWEFEETWEIRSSYYSLYKMVDGYPQDRQIPEEQVYFCWKNFTSSELLIGNTVQLSEDRVSEKLLFRIPAGSEKLGHRYSVLVRQFALTKEAYDFYQLMKKNTESLGSIFDSQPSEITGNIRSLSDPAEKVIGFISVAPSQESRIFISKDEVPDWNFRMNCNKTITIPNSMDSITKYFTHGEYLPYSARKIGFVVLEWYGAERRCTDCTTRNGSTEKPWFW
jgi:hypothetical protein